MPLLIPGGSGTGGGSGPGQLTPLVTPTAASTLPLWCNQGSATVTDEADGLYLEGDATASTANLHCRLQALTSGRKTTLAFLPNGRAANFVSMGLVVTAGTAATAAVVAFSLVCDSGWKWELAHYAAANASSGTGDGTEPVGWGGSLAWLQLDDTGGTNFLFRVSSDGQHWGTVFSQGRTAVLTPSHVGVYVSSNGSNTVPGLKAVHWTHV